MMTDSHREERKAPPADVTREAPRALVMIVDRDQAGHLEELLRGKAARQHLMINGVGTARSEILKALGLSGTKKVICVCLLARPRLAQVRSAVADRFEFYKPGRGIAFSLPVSALTAAAAAALASEMDSNQARGKEMRDMEREGENVHELVVSIVDQGYSDAVMSAARGAGARGGTILNARWTGSAEKEKFLGIAVQDEREVVLIIVPKAQQREIMRALGEACGANTPARGIIFSVPVESCVGLAQASLT